VPFGPHPLPPHEPALDRVAVVLDPILAPLGFAAGQAGASGGHGQVIFCRGFVDSTDGACVDLVVDLEAMPDWRITGVRYWGTRATGGICRSILTATSRRSCPGSCERSPTSSRDHQPAVGDTRVTVRIGGSTRRPDLTGL
jgi:hypothetical protein